MAPVTLPGGTLKRIFIIGPGRSGTTFLVKLFTRLGFNTGFTPYREENYLKEKRAGCEVVLSWDEDNIDSKIKRDLDAVPFQVIKSPYMSFVLAPLIKRNLISVKHIFIPLRNLDDTTRSRMDVELYWKETPETFNDQRNYSALAIGYAIDLCITYNLPYTIMKFPDFVEDPFYCHEMLSEGVELPWHRFLDVFSKTVDLKNIKFGGK